MKVLLVNKYFFPKGGAEVSFLETAKLLANKGHEVIFFSMKETRNINSDYSNYFISNVNYKNQRFKNIIRASFKLLYSFEAKEKIERLIRDQRPNIVHLNNIYHQISPSIIHSIKKYNIPIVMSLRDYKVVCASYLMLANGRICNACKGRKYYNCFVRGCVKNSRMKSLLNTFEMYLHHYILDIYNLIDIFISPSNFLKDKLKEMGFKGKILHLPNFVESSKCNPNYNWKEKYIIYFGRLSKEKGLYTLIETVKGLNVKLKIVGDGPIKEDLERKIMASECENVELLGYKEGEDLKKEINNSMFTVLPSQCYENNPRSIMEGFALGKPAVGSRIGGIPELVKDNETGLTFQSGNAEDLRAKLIQLLKNQNEIKRMGKNGQRYVKKEFAPEIHYEKLIKIYKSFL